MSLFFKNSDDPSLISHYEAMEILAQLKGILQHLNLSGKSHYILNIFYGLKMILANEIVFALEKMNFIILHYNALCEYAFKYKYWGDLYFTRVKKSEAMASCSEKGILKDLFMRRGLT